MPIMRPRVRFLRCFFCFAVVIFVLPRRSLATQGQTPQTQEQIQARNALNQGVQAFKNGQTDEATRLFERAKQLDPTLLNARLYLATSYAAQYIPGAPGEENKRLGQRAVEEYKNVLQLDAQNLSAIDGIGSLLFQMAGAPSFDPDMMQESKSFHQKHTQIRPEDAVPYYWIGVIDWTLAFRANTEIRVGSNQKNSGHGIRDDEPLPRDVRHEYTREYGPMIEEGVQNLRKALELKPDYDDAMAYLSLMYRRKADTVDTQVEYDELEKMADELIDRVKEIKENQAGSQPRPR